MAGVRYPALEPRQTHTAEPAASPGARHGASPYAIMGEVDLSTWSVNISDIVLFSLQINRSKLSHTLANILAYKVAAKQYFPACGLRTRLPQNYCQTYRDVANTISTKLCSANDHFLSHISVPSNTLTRLSHFVLLTSIYSPSLTL
ncbi:hypothetical protein RRG08_036049 [Elysia crispata]|uniref:Uncharacterized protein n=1 Tax=Elysia crispata TaxID=231223 RepID=A0AAE1AMA1_9GAST|nr:hypothetical protein RRG08_036049 [Elysia crispata]